MTFGNISAPRRRFEMLNRFLSLFIVKNVTMKKVEQTLNKRREFVKSEIRNRQAGDKIDKTVRELADQLFLSPATIWKDYEYQAPQNNNRY